MDLPRCKWLIEDTTGCFVKSMYNWTTVVSFFCPANRHVCDLTAEMVFVRGTVIDSSGIDTRNTSIRLSFELLR